MGPPYTTSNPPDVPILRPSLKLLSTKGSIIPVEMEEEGLLRREYVLVGDTQVGLPWSGAVWFRDPFSWTLNQTQVRFGLSR